MEDFTDLHKDNLLMIMYKIDETEMDKLTLKEIYLILKENAITDANIANKVYCLTD